MTNPTQYFKAIKNETEINATKNAHLKDGVAMTKFMYWLKTNIGKMKITEISAADKLEELRRNDKELCEIILYRLKNTLDLRYNKYIQYLK